MQFRGNSHSFLQNFIRTLTRRLAYVEQEVVALRLILEANGIDVPGRETDPPGLASDRFREEWRN